MSLSEPLKILIVEDEFFSAEFISQEVKKLGYEVVSVVDNALDAKEVFLNNEVDLVLMDINIVGSVDGISCAKELNLIRPVAVIFLSAYGDSETIKEAIQTNIFGFLIKPFDKNDLIATLSVAVKRINDVKKHLSIKDAQKIVFSPDYIYDKKNNMLLIKNSPVKLTKKESKTLHLLIENINRCISYEALTDYVWDNKDISISAIRDTILRIRKKAPLLNIETISGVGYYLKV